jgi:transposase-like protein
VSETGREYWSRLIAEQEASGQNVKPFCRERGIGEASFYYWRRRMREDQPVRFAVLETRKTSKTKPPAPRAEISVDDAAG